MVVAILPVNKTPVDNVFAWWFHRTAIG